LYPSSGAGAWEAAIVNTLSSGDRVLMTETCHFATLWRQMAVGWGLVVDFVPGDWRRAADPTVIEARLVEDRAHMIKAVMVVHNETSTGSTSNIARVRKAIDAAAHPALLLVDAISSLGSIDVRHDEWRINVSVSGSQNPEPELSRRDPHLPVVCHDVVALDAVRRACRLGHWFSFGETSGRRINRLPVILGSHHKRREPACCSQNFCEVR
jgi:hypothetical protein